MQTMAKKKGSGSRTGLGSIFERVDLSGEAASSSSGSGRSQSSSFQEVESCIGGEHLVLGQCLVRHVVGWNIGPNCFIIQLQFDLVGRLLG